MNKEDSGRNSIGSIRRNGRSGRDGAIMAPPMPMRQPYVALRLQSGVQRSCPARFDGAPRRFAILFVVAGNQQQVNAFLSVSLRPVAAAHASNGRSLYGSGSSQVSYFFAQSSLPIKFRAVLVQHHLLRNPIHFSQSPSSLSSSNSRPHSKLSTVCISSIPSSGSTIIEQP